MCFVFFSLPWYCLDCAELHVCGPYHSTAASGGSRSVKQSRNKARAKEHLRVSGSGAGSLSQGWVKVKAEMGETKEKKAKTAAGMSSHTKSEHQQVSLVLVLGRRKCEWQGCVISAQENLTALSTPVVSTSISFPLSHPGL